MAIIKNLDFTNGTIELEVNGGRRPDSDTTNRGFIGLAFRVQEKDTISYECFYIRPDTVSYTHLDVYKRQVLNGWVPFWWYINNLHPETFGYLLVLKFVSCYSGI